LKIAGGLSMTREEKDHLSNLKKGGPGTMANLFEEFFQIHEEAAEEALKDAIDNTVDTLTGNDDDDDEEDD
jgi:hypothetical protein